MGTIKEKTMSVALKKVNQYIEKNPEQNIPKILDWLDKFDTSGMISSQLSVVRDVLNDQDNNWTQLVYSLYTDIDKDVRAKLFENFIINAVVLGLKH